MAKEKVEVNDNDEINDHTPETSEELLEKTGFDGVDANVINDINDDKDVVSKTEKEVDKRIDGQEQSEVLNSTEETVDTTEKADEEDIETNTDEKKSSLQFKLIQIDVDGNIGSDIANRSVIDSMFHMIKPSEAFDNANRNASEIITNGSTLVVDGIGSAGKSTHTRSIRMIREGSISSHNLDVIKSRVYNANFSSMDKALVRAKDLTVDELKWLGIGASDSDQEALLAEVRDDGENPASDAKYYTHKKVNDRASLLAKTMTFIIDYINNNLVVIAKVKKSDTDGEVFIFFEEDDKPLLSNIQVSFTVPPDGKSCAFAIKLNKSVLDAEGVTYIQMFTHINSMFDKAGFTYTMEEIETKGLYTTFGVDLDLDIKFMVPILLLSSHVVVSAWNAENIILPSASKVSSAYLKGGSAVATVALISKLSIFTRKYVKTLTLEYLDLFNIEGAGLISANCNYIQLSGSFGSTEHVADSNISEIRFRDSNIVHAGVIVWENLYILITALRNNFAISKNPNIAKLIVSVTEFSKLITAFMNSMNLPDQNEAFIHTLDSAMAYFCELLDNSLKEENVVCSDLVNILTKNDLVRMKLVQ